MGGHTFTDYVEGIDVETAFRAAVVQAQYEHGHGGYTGTIAEKHKYVVIDGVPMSESDAEALAATLISNDSRIGDNAGPAGAIAVRGGPRELAGLPVPGRVGGYPDQKTAALAAVEGRLGDSETVTSFHLSGYRTRRGGIDVDTNTTATITTAGSPDMTGWLFFGWASS